MTQEEINKVAQEYAKAMAKLFPELKEKRKYRDQISQAKNVINILLSNYVVFPKYNYSKQTVTMEGWVAKDLTKDGVSHLLLSEFKPFMKTTGSFIEHEYIHWEAPVCFQRFIPSDAFPSVTCSNSPKRVKITIELEEEE